MEGYGAESGSGTEESGTAGNARVGNAIDIALDISALTAAIDIIALDIAATSATDGPGW